jgi:hypothetical protein
VAKTQHGGSEQQSKQIDVTCVLEKSWSHLGGGRLYGGTHCALGEGTFDHDQENQLMSDTPRVAQPKTKTEELPKDIEQLVAALGELPAEQRDAIQPLLARVLQSTRRRRRILNLVQDALGQLRLDMKYLIFDLEATRRERDEYRRQVESNAEEGLD